MFLNMLLIIAKYLQVWIKRVNFAVQKEIYLMDSFTGVCYFFYVL